MGGWGVCLKLTIFCPAELSSFVVSNSAQVSQADNFGSRREGARMLWRCTNAKDAFRGFGHRLAGGVRRSIRNGRYSSAARDRGDCPADKPGHSPQVTSRLTQAEVREA